MFTILLTLIIFLSIALLPSVLATFFSTHELIEMGILREDTGSQNVLSEAASSCICVIACI